MDKKYFKIPLLLTSFSASIVAMYIHGDPVVIDLDGTLGTIQGMLFIAGGIGQIMYFKYYTNWGIKNERTFK
jgi:hypothetical protein